MSRAPGGVTSAALAERLGRAVGRGTNGNGKMPQNGNGAVSVPSARDAALDVCRAILAEAGAGTTEHSNDVVLISEALGEHMGFAETEAEDLLVAAQLHDIGKAWVPSRILEKPGPLTDAEWALMRQHTIVGEEILSSVDELVDVGHLVRHSHERWDGGGYPDGLEAEEIPLGSRIIFCADTFHAIRCDRPYRAGRSADEAIAEIRRCSGTQFDPAVAEALGEVVRERRSQPRGMRSSRLFALLMCLVVGGAGTALARSNLLGDPGASPPSSAPTPPPACGTAGCPTVAGPVGGLAPVGGPGWIPGPRVLHPGLPGRLQRGVEGGNRGGGEGRGGNGNGGQAKPENASKAHGKAGGHSGGSHSGGSSSSSHSSAGATHSSSGHGKGDSAAGGQSIAGDHSSGGDRPSGGGSSESSQGPPDSGSSASNGISGGSTNAGGAGGSHGK